MYQRMTAMARARYLRQRGHSWEFQINVPRELRGRFLSKGGNEISKVVVSLGTRDLTEAQRKCWPLVQEWTERFQRAATNLPLTPAEIEAEAREVYTSTLERLEADAKRGLLPAAPDQQAEALSIALDRLIEAIAPPDMDSWDRREIDLDQQIEGMTDFEFVADDIAGVRRRKGIEASELEPGTPIHKLLGQAIVRAKFEAMNGRLRALRGEPSEPPATFLGAQGIDPISLKPIKPVRKTKIRLRTDEGMTFSEAAARYIDEIQRDPGARITEQTRRQIEAVFRLFTQYTNDASLAAIDKATASEFLDAVANLDPHWGRSSQAKEMSWDDIQTKFGSGDAQLTNRTINRYVSAISSVFKWADKRGYFEGRNPFQNQSRKEAEGTGWVPYTIEELNTLFHAPLFNVPVNERIRPSKHTVETALRWVPLIALYSGMRLGEICQLRTGDVKHEGKIWYFNVSEEAEGQSVKTAAGIRKVPVHSMLIRCGFLDYLKALPEGQLFPALKPGGPDGKLSWYFTRRYTEFRRTLEINRPRVSFHSFRKNVATALDNASVNRGDIAALIGHERGFTLETYSGGKGLKALQSIAEKIKYPGMRLNHLQI